MLEELAHTWVSHRPWKLYPLLHGLERGGLLKSALKNIGGRQAKGLQDHGGRRESFRQKPKAK